jgi:hypothetical protein
VLGHFLEEDGLPTTQISLIRPHTEVIRPPRALWVPFELGRPLGVPENPDFQTRVLMAALDLFAAPAGPILKDFPEEAPAYSGEPVVLACPYVPPVAADDAGETDSLCRALTTEIASMRPWYDRALKDRRRTAVGTSKLAPEAIGNFICAFVKDTLPANPDPSVPLSFELRYAADDLKAYYYEAITAQPGASGQNSEALDQWFWETTVAAKVLRAVREVCLKSKDEALQRAGGRQIIPSKFLD